MSAAIRQSLVEAKGSATDITELESLMSKVKGLLDAKAAGPTGFERERAREWRLAYAATYEAPPKPARAGTAATGSLQDLAAVDGSSSFGSLVRSLTGLNGLYHRHLADADELEGKGEKDKAGALRDEASRARQAFGRVEGLLRGKTISADAMERARAHEWFKTPDAFTWEHRKAAGKVGEKQSPADMPVTAADSTGKLIAKYEALYGVFQGEQAAFVKDAKEEHRARAENARSEAARVLALISAKR